MASPSRTTRWSSATRTLTRPLGLRSSAPGSASRAAPARWRSRAIRRRPDPPRPRLRAGRPVRRSPAIRSRPRWLRAARAAPLAAWTSLSIVTVTYSGPKASWIAVRGASGMLDDVGQRLLRHPVERQDRLGRERAPLARRLEGGIVLRGEPGQALLDGSASSRRARTAPRASSRPSRTSRACDRVVRDTGARPRLGVHDRGERLELERQRGQRVGEDVVQLAGEWLRSASNSARLRSTSARSDASSSLVICSACSTA